MERVIIPIERTLFLLGRENKTKRSIEAKAKAGLVVIDGEVTIDGEDAFLVYRCSQVVKAIGRGFAPFKAMNLFDSDFYLKVYNIKDFSGKSKNRMGEIKGRLIGRNGKARKYIESSTGCFISIYGHTVSIIGKYPSIGSAERAVEMLLEGSEHSAAYRFLRGEKIRALRNELFGESFK